LLSQKRDEKKRILKRKGKFIMNDLYQGKRGVGNEKEAPLKESEGMWLEDGEKLKGRASNLHEKRGLLSLSSKNRVQKLAHRSKEKATRDAKSGP